jgi:hypothetical protein
MNTIYIAFRDEDESNVVLSVHRSRLFAEAAIEKDRDRCAMTPASLPWNGYHIEEHQLL